MGAYLRKPVTDKTSECGEYTVGERKFLYAATAMQGWRVAMEDAHAIIPHFDKDTSLFAVYDGHGGKEVAVYCAAKLGDVIKSTESYRKGDVSQALKDAFMKCDEMIMKPEIIQEMKEMMKAEVSAESGQAEEEEEDTQEELSALIEEAHMPLHSLLAKYGATNPSKDAEVGDNDEAPDVKSVLQMMANQAGIEIEFEDSDSGSESNENENENEHEDDDELGDIDDVITGSGKGEVEAKKDSDQVKVVEDKKAISQHSRQSHSVEATKFSLTSLLTSSATGTSYTSAPISSPSEMTSASLTDTSQSLHRNSQDFKSPLSNTLLPNHRKALSSNFNGHNVEKSLHSKCEGNHEQFVKSSTDKSLSTDTKSESRTNTVDSSDTTSSDMHDGNDDSTTSLNSNPNTEVSQARPTTDSSSAPTSRTKAVGLMDLLTTAVEDKDSAVVVDTSEDKWMSPPPVKEVPFTRRSRKRPHPDDDMDDLTLSEYSAKRHEIMDEEGYHSGTTAVVCILKGDELTVANAGDSRCVVSSKGKALEMSFDHKPTDPPELERIAKAGGQVGIDGRVNGGLNLTRAIGDHFYKGNTSLPLAEQMITAMPDIETLRITEDEEFIFLACDGIWNSKSSQDVVDFINCRISEKTVDGPPTADDLVAICKSLCDACLAADTDNDGTGCDNMTCLLVLLQPA